MKGAHRIIVESKKVKYDFTIKRNITILTGNSGSGKTVLIELIRDYRRYGSDSGVFLSCDRECRTIDNEDIEQHYIYRRRKPFPEIQKICRPAAEIG